ncbi:MAG: hypothetical protein AB1659_08060 [Thermodesulfobacteriota bacterium]
MDDDPTGTQTVYNVRCLTTRGEETIAEEFASHKQDPDNGEKSG